MSFSRSPSRATLAATVSVLILLTARFAQGQTCSAQAGPSQQLPPFSGTSSGITSTGGGNQHLYVDTEWGIARFSLANPAAPSPGSLANVGIDYSQGGPPDYNGGKVPIHGDSHQGPTWYGAADAPDGSGRAVMDWSPQIGQGDDLPNHVVMATGNGPLQFGQSINSPGPGSSGLPIVVAYIGGSFYAYTYAPSGISITNVTSPNGSAGLIPPAPGFQDPAQALQLQGSFNAWGGPSTLTVGNVSMSGLGKTLLAGTAGGALHVGTINANGTVTDSGASLGMSNNVYSLSVVNVGTKVVIFTAEGNGGIHGYEFTGSSLLPGSTVIPGNFDYLVVRGSYPNLIIAAHNPPARQIQTFDTKWMLTGNGTPIVGPTLLHDGSPNNYFGKWVESVVVNNTAYVYRIGNGAPQKNLYTDILDVSCLTADLLSPPVASATWVNKSAQLRSGVEATINYYGDRFVLTDASASGTPITRVDWDLNSAGVTQADFIPDPSLTTASSIGGLNGLVFPCDPAAGGGTDPLTGANCRQSVGLSATPGAGSFKFGEKSWNVNGAATNAFFSPGIPFVMPQALVANMVGGTLSILTNGSADSTPTQGHPISWQWTFSGGSGGSSNLPVAPVPLGTTSFTLTVGYDGGYSASTNGSVVITDLVPAFSIVPSTASLGATVTLTNTMQIATGFNVTSVDYFVLPGGCPGNPGVPTGTLAATFNAQGGTAQITAPATAGSYCVMLRYSYRLGVGTPIVSPTMPSQSLTVQNAALTGSVSASPASVAPGAATTVTASVTGGVPPYFYQWDCNYSTFSGGNWGQIGSATSTSCSWSVSGGHTPGVRVTDSNTPGTVLIVYGNVTVTGSTGGSISASISGSTSPAVGAATTYAASASGGTGSYTYAWACDYTPLFPAFNVGSSSVQCSYPTPGNKTVAVKVTDTGSGVAVQTLGINVGGGSPGPGGLAVSVTGPSTGSQNQALTYTAVGTGGTPGYTYAWACDYTPVGGPGQFVTGSNTKTCTFTTNGTHVVGARVTDSTSGSAVNTYSTNITGPALPSAAFTVTGATIAGTTITAGKGQPVTFTSSEPNCSSWGWNFGDGTLGTGRSITKTYGTLGSYTGQIIVSGNGTGAAGMNIGSFTINVVTPPPSGAFTVEGAQANSNSTVFTANVGDELTLSSAEPSANVWAWDFGDGTSGAARSVKKGYSAVGTYTVKLLVWGKEPDTTGTTLSSFTVNVVSCVTNATTLCLNNNRFRASVNWSVPDQGKTGSGSAVSLTGDTGYFWFFSPTNIELVLKVVDGRPFNGKFWVFYGALSDVQYDISIKDATTGVVKTYHNPYHTTASVADIDAFDGGGTTATATEQVKKPLASYTVTCAPSTITVGQSVTCTASPAGPAYQWDFGESFPPQYAPGPNPNSHTYNTVGTRTISVTTDGGLTYATANVAITAGGGSTITPTISGPATGTTGSPVNFSGSATGGTPPYSYAWDCNYNAGNPSYVAGTASNPCTYTTAGIQTVGLRVTDSASPSGSGVATTTVNISAPAGPGLPSAGFTLSGATLNPVTNRYETEIGRQVTFTADETNASQWGWDFGDGSVGGGSDPANRVATHIYPQLGSWAGQLLVYGDSVHTTGLSIGAIPITVLRCAGDSKTLCLNNGRFKVQVSWQSADSSGDGTAVPVTADTGEFWFLTSNNIELVLKVVDGTSFNGHFWVFYGALSNLQYDITITDTTTGVAKTYHNPLGTTASVADVDAF